ncbi:uncharacterized protein LAESUDRAFT_814396 [Laetiporus sulphureus 93-53]|uniref:Uncharacterized protein n=1 Tax=Laetiporus sulphureus 93-53 TaxID=1314785 RepID=A0A165D299_9APHY|nr:uncharacterized protein LAESUDRAFT_814396 [Laetiporus sulphureus 93-53]KZT04009.1 hypothetical protein LAESUDRAFT_814396 [Laetiporus sulphureus 93-53]
MFFGEFSLSQFGGTPVMKSMDSGFIQTNQTGSGYNDQSNLNFHYTMTSAGPTLLVQLNQVLDDGEATSDASITIACLCFIAIGASFGNLLDALDGTYCTYEDGYNPTFHYPQPYSSCYSLCFMITVHVALSSTNYLITVQDEWWLVCGTWCSFPPLPPCSPLSTTYASAARLAISKGPKLHQPSKAFNGDITSSNNPGCRMNAFSAEPCWDPVLSTCQHT